MDDDYRILARFMIPTDAHMMRGCLAAAGIAAVVADDQHMQANLLLAPAIGGARLLVLEKDARAAEEILQAFQRGELALPDDADFDPACNAQIR